MTRARRILILSFSRIESDPRVLRQIRTLSRSTALTVAGFGPSPSGDIDYVELPARRGAVARLVQGATLGLRMYEHCYWSAARVREAERLLAGKQFDVVVANDIHAMPLARRVGKGAGVLLDAHEFAPTEFSDRIVWRLLFQPYVEYLCRRYIPTADAMTTVADGIAEQYRIELGAAPTVVYSAPPFADLQPASPERDRIRLIHHGSALPSRKLEDMIELAGALDERFTLDLMLTLGEPAYLDRLKALAARKPRVRVIPPVRTAEIVRFSNAYDVGLYILPPATVNSRYALPNKFFEFIQARLAVAVGPSPEMKRLVEKYDCGIVGSTFDVKEMAARLTALNGVELARLKDNASRAARELCWEKVEAGFLAAVEKAMEARPCAA